MGRGGVRSSSGGSQGTAKPLHRAEELSWLISQGAEGQAGVKSTQRQHPLPWADLGQQSQKITLDTAANLASLYRLLPSLCAAVTSSDEEI